MKRRHVPANKSPFGTCDTPWPAQISIQERRWMPFLESKWPKNLEGQGQWHPFSVPAKKISICIFAANLVILAQIRCKLSRGQIKFPRIRCQNGQYDLEGQGQWPPFSIPAASIPGCMFGENLPRYGRQLGGQNNKHRGRDWPNPTSPPCVNFLKHINYGFNLASVFEVPNRYYVLIQFP